MALDVRRKGEPAPSAIMSHWWNKSRDQIASSLTAAAEGLEFATWQDRYMSFVCGRLMTGRAMPATFGCTMSERSQRAAGSTWKAEFNAPALNCIGAAADVLQNKVYHQRPFMRFRVPRGDFKARMASQYQTEFIDQLLEDLAFWPMMYLAGIDCMTYPAAYIKVGEGMDGMIEHTSVYHDELLYMGARPRSLIQRLFVNREDAIARYARGERADVIKSGLMRARGVRPGFYRAAVDYEDTIALCEGWRLPLPDGTPGKRALVVDNVWLEVDKWERSRFPFAKLMFQPVSGSWSGQSLAEISLPMQRKLDRVSLTIDETERRNAWPRWTYPSLSMINPEMFKGPGFVPYMGSQPPTPLIGPAASKELYQQQFNLVTWIFQRLGISQGTSQGETPTGLNSGIAILAFNQVDDSRHVAILEALEDTVTDVAKLDIELAEELNLKLVIDGKTKHWNDIADKKTIPRAFPMSRLPTLPAAKLQQIENWELTGKITKQEAVKLNGSLDTEGFEDAYAASDNLTQKKLDEMIENGVSGYQPPSPYGNLQAQLSMAQARIQTEETRGTPTDRLMVIAYFVSATVEMIDDDRALTPPQNPAIGAAPGAAAPQLVPMPGAEQIQPSPEIQAPAVDMAQPQMS